MTGIKQRDELQSTIWKIANEVRGAVDGWDFKQFVLGTLFYRFISENFTSYIEGGDDSIHYADMSDDVITTEIKDDAIKTKGYFIYPSQLFVNIAKSAYINPNLNTDLAAIFDAIEGSANGYPSEHDIKGLFADFDTTSNRLGNTVEEKNKRLAAVIKGVESLDFGNFEDNEIDLFGDAYEFLISNYAANAGKSGGEFFTPQNVSKLIAQLALSGQTSVNKIYDPACGSGNFLTETYIKLRRLENKVILELNARKGQFDFGGALSPVKVQISQFYGIEINDFACAVAETALWIAESQMLKETEDIIGATLEFFPLKTNTNIHEGNALRLDWAEIVEPTELSYIMGNPPFSGARFMSKEQKADLLEVFGDNWKNAGDIDYVGSWFKKACDLMQGSRSIRAAFVATNSLTQGTAVANLWAPLLESGAHIDFAWRTFIWDSEATEKAHVHCVIVGFSYSDSPAQKIIFEDDHATLAAHINAYLIDGEDIVASSRSRPLCDVPEIGMGNQPIDDGNYLFTEEEKADFLKMEPEAKDLFKEFYGAKEFINPKNSGKVPLQL